MTLLLFRLAAVPFFVLPRGWYSVCEIIRIYHECEAGKEKSVPRITFWHHRACRVMTNGDPNRRIFYPTLTPIMDSFSCSPINTSFYIGKNMNKCFQKILNRLRCDMVMSFYHCNEVTVLPAASV